MLRALLTLSSAMALVWCAAAFAQQPRPVPIKASGHKGVNVGSLSCKVDGGTGFVFGSTKALSCIFSRTDGVAERYVGEIERFGVDIGYTNQAHMVWLVFAPGSVASGSLAGSYVGATAQAFFSAGFGTNILLGGSNKQVSLQPASVEGGEGLNVAGGVVEISLRAK